MVDRKKWIVSYLDLFSKKCLWAPATNPVNVSGDLIFKEFTGALQHLKPGKVSGLNSLYPELIIHIGTALKSWLRGFILLAPTQNSNEMEKIAGSHYSYTDETC